ncbi:hypothetical protein HDU76_003240 [Blyttiomyces sp. JEL0837]|nr:hypothetical protein HDU76_003240 [Blyttiomyces sp. JEL0837]
MNALENYLQNLLDDPTITQSEELRLFLSLEYSKMLMKQQTAASPSGSSGGIMSPKDYTTQPNTFQKISTMIRRPKSHSKSGGRGGKSDKEGSDRPSSVVYDSTTAPNETEADSTNNNNSRVKSYTDLLIGGSMSYLVDAVTGILIELLEFKEQNPWLKQNSALALIKKLAGVESLEKFLTTTLKHALSDENLTQTLTTLTTSISTQPDDQNPATKSTTSPGQQPPHLPTTLHILNTVFQTPVSTSSLNEDPTTTPPSTTPKQTHNLLTTVLTDSLTRFLGPELSNQRITWGFEMLQSKVLNRHVLYNLLDVVVKVLVDALESSEM